MTASGHDISRMYVDAFVDGHPAEPVVSSAEHLFHVVPLSLVRRYVSPEDAALVRRLARAGKATNPLLYRAERDPRRWASILAAQLNQFRKFARHYPN
ncbi:hypothetical protein [Georgenia sp. SUBG003]|uniref:hypothetical protein n=1 Tax=Georgenia sp. SUBG003 TaxID=1497974 RepID=UPI003AB6DE92